MQPSRPLRQQYITTARHLHTERRTMRRNGRRRPTISNNRPTAKNSTWKKPIQPNRSSTMRPMSRSQTINSTNRHLRLTNPLTKTTIPKLWQRPRPRPISPTSRRSNTNRSHQYHSISIIQEASRQP